MKVYRVILAKTIVGIVTEHNKVTKAHPVTKVKEGMSIEKAKELVKKNKGKIARIR